ncbi:MAG: bifunctional phosphopantothenoylcysteine decarboxylase/phosphopantothenate--cysteine ligase CoaBC [Candidatus Mycalebacterium zealandia]|nr:MAG: bifunctional phosphopantothenoylcysteine decarboxylase/phosphopantothenate--cysteine ligase CoaBC [Candidatus Mycalebacterium zealandia]
MSVLEDKKIVLGVTGSIAAYKSCEITRELMRRGAQVQVVMTKNAEKFITPLTLQTLSGKKAVSDPFDLQWESEIGHISLADGADAIVVAPATASFIGKMAGAIADTLLGAVILATKAPVVVCPAMNVNMYSNPLVRGNFEKLTGAGVVIVGPAEGDLACGWEGKGRLSETEEIIAEIERAVAPDDFKGKKLLVTAGASREYIDPVRFISNPSTGKMGCAIARAGWLRGADVVLVSGAGAGIDLPGMRRVEAKSVQEMFDVVMENAGDADFVIKAAAVGDYAPAKEEKEKIKKTSETMCLQLEKTPDILEEVGKSLKKNGRGKKSVVVGFSAETQSIIENSQKKLKKKNADMIVANDVSAEGSGFGTDTNQAVFIKPEGEPQSLPLMTKDALGHKILDAALGIYEGKYDNG